MIGRTPVIAAPVTHSYGLIAGVMVGLGRGRVPVVLDSANPKTILRQLAGIETPLLYAAPTLLHVLARLAGEMGIDMPVVAAVAKLLTGSANVDQVLQELLARPPRPETH